MLFQVYGVPKKMPVHCKNYANSLFTGQHAETFANIFANLRRPDCSVIYLIARFPTAFFNDSLVFKFMGVCLLVKENHMV